ncbi:hypothetical protein BCV72DRAFT_334449 [Rhizopus microsporus var. microsporus]|uniref:Uncharacterized protein n=1 Tax=Rhizopus microsporus var. microsporus TaxID=86635 RepID=A0A1X0R8T7_RHIZD|nr:hypothetical protein BCV72DRAFT_334449 [Rhizopus microsporus var. microsporus]
MALSAINKCPICNVTSDNPCEITDSCHNPNNAPFKHKACTQTLKQQKSEAFDLPTNTSDAVFLEGIDPYSIIISTSQFVRTNFKAKSLNVILQEQFSAGIRLRQRHIGKNDNYIEINFASTATHSEALCNYFALGGKTIKVSKMLDRNVDSYCIGILNISLKQLRYCGLNLLLV